MREIRAATFFKVKICNQAQVWRLGIAILLSSQLQVTVLAEDEPLPPIQARSFASKTLEKSKSGRTYIFENLENADLPRVGRILLLKQNEEPTIAVRVMRTYEEQGRFAAKRVKGYKKNAALEPGDVTSTLEKLGDLEPIAPPTAQELADLKELEKKTETTQNPTEPLPPLPPPVEPPPPAAPTEITPPPSAPPVAEPPPFTPQGNPAPAYDPELDRETSPPPDKDAGSHSQDLEDSEEDVGEDPADYLMVNDVQPKDIYKSWLTLGLAEMRNNNSDGTSAYYESVGLRYGYTFRRYLLAKSAKLQDSLTAEGGLSVYRVLEYEANQNDAYTVVPVTATLRYNLHLSDTMTLFTYAGLVMNRVLSMANGSEEALGLLNSFMPAAGVGIFFQVGPQWYTRLDLGLDSLGLGLVLRF